MVNQSNFTPEAATCFSERQAFDTAKLTCLIVFGGLGVIGNTLIIILAVKFIERKNFHYLIINMSVSDILVVLMFTLRITDFSLPSNTPKTLADIICKTYGGVEYISELVTLITLFIISVERYRATRLSLEAKAISSRCLTAATLLASLLLSLYRIFVMYVSQSPPNHRYSCNAEETSELYNAFFLLRSVAIVFLYFSVFICSITTSRKMLKVLPVHANLSDEQRRRRQVRTKRAVRMVLYSLLLYSICYLPDFVEDIIEGIYPHIYSGMDKNCLKLLVFLIHIPKLMNSCFSPIIYLLLLGDFRNAAKNLFWKRHEPTNNVTI